MKERFFRNRTAVFTVVFVLLVGLGGHSDSCHCAQRPL